MSVKIRKERKACWVYECRDCNVLATGPDQWSVYEFQWNHERNAAHAMKVIGAAFQPIVDAFAQLSKVILPTVEQFQKDFGLIPPPNILHDPTLLKDRRIWGGR